MRFWGQCTYEGSLRLGIAAEPETVDWDDGSGRSSFVAQLADRLRETDDHDHMLRNTVKGTPAEVGRLLE